MKIPVGSLWHRRDDRERPRTVFEVMRRSASKVTVQIVCGHFRVGSPCEMPRRVFEREFES